MLNLIILESGMLHQNASSKRVQCTRRCRGYSVNLVRSSPQETRIYRLPSRTGRVYRIRTRYVPTVVGFPLK